MLQLPIGELLGALQKLSGLQQTVSPIAEQWGAFHLAAVSYREVDRAAGAFISACADMGLAVTHSIAVDMAKALRSARQEGADMVIDGHALQNLDAHLRGIGNTLRREAATKAVLVLPPEKAALLDPPEPHFGRDVRGKFPSAIPEIDEAAKCLALGRATASVFHLMRALEVVLKAVHASLGLPLPKSRNWTDWLIPIREERLKRGGTKWAENNFFQDVWQRLDSIKDAQRNSTMHVESIYTEEDAHVVLEATKSFMQKVAARMDQNGDPKA